MGHHNRSEKARLLIKITAGGNPSIAEFEAYNDCIQWREEAHMKLFIAALAVGFGLFVSGTCVALDKKVSLLTKQPIGELAVAGRLSVDLHAEFMVSRTYEHETVLNWYNCGYSGGGNYNTVGGNFGDFGLQVPFTEREAKYPHAVTVESVRAVRFDGNDFLKGNFAVEKKIAGPHSMALEVWFRSEHPSKGEVILGWQSKDGQETSAPIRLPRALAARGKWRHLVVNCSPQKRRLVSGWREGLQRATQHDHP